MKLEKELAAPGGTRVAAIIFMTSTAPLEFIYRNVFSNIEGRGATVPDALRDLRKRTAEVYAALTPKTCETPVNRDFVAEYLNDQPVEEKP